MDQTNSRCWHRRLLADFTLGQHGPSCTQGFGCFYRWMVHSGLVAIRHIPIEKPFSLSTIDADVDHVGQHF